METVTVKKGTKEPHYSRIPAGIEMKRPRNTPKHYIPASPKGGGLPIWADPDDLEDIEYDPDSSLRFGYAMINHTVAYACRADNNHRWNGWACPHLLRHEKERLVEDYLADEYEYYVTREEKEHSEHFYKRVGYEKGDDDMIIYQSRKDGSLATDGWCWDLYFPEDVVAVHSFTRAQLDAYLAHQDQPGIYFERIEGRDDCTVLALTEEAEEKIQYYLDSKSA